MTKREIIARELDQLSDQDLDRVLVFLCMVAQERAETSIPALAAESALAKDWLTIAEDAAWMDL